MKCYFCNNEMSWEKDFNYNEIHGKVRVLLVVGFVQVVELRQNSARKKIMILNQCLVMNNKELIK